MNVGIVANGRYEGLPAILGAVALEARRLGFTLFTEPGLVDLWDAPVGVIGDAPLDALVTFGGDGTLLRGARLFAGIEIPILGVNLGRVGFLTATSREHFIAALEALVAGHYFTEPRDVLEPAIVGDEGSRSLPPALNDVVVHKGGLARIIRLHVTVNGEAVGPYTADGIIVATPTGSTAYSMSAGGPVIVPGVQALVLTPICAHTLAVRPLVIPAASLISIEPIAPWDEDLLVSVDGQQLTTLHPGERVEIKPSPVPVLLVRLEPRGYFARMRQTLRWGDLSDRENPR